jgi:RNA polymerase sigma-70 factor (ECF subfamily)
LDDSEFDHILGEVRNRRGAGVAALYRIYNPVLIRFLRAQASGMGEDLAHDTWLAAGPTLPEFEGTEKQFRIWLLSIARSLLAAYRESLARTQTSTVDPRRLADVVQKRRTEDMSVADAALARLLAGVRPAHAEILLLRVVGGLTAEETGALVGKSAGAVRVIQHRALHQLAKRLSHEQVAG